VTSLTVGGLAARILNVLLGAGQAPPQTAEPVPWAPRAGLATRLSDFTMNRHE